MLRRTTGTARGPSFAVQPAVPANRSAISESSRNHTDHRALNSPYRVVRLRACQRLPYDGGTTSARGRCSTASWWSTAADAAAAGRSRRATAGVAQQQRGDRAETDQSVDLGGAEAEGCGDVAPGPQRPGHGSDIGDPGEPIVLAPPAVNKRIAELSPFPCDGHRARLRAENGAKRASKTSVAASYRTKVFRS
jgi:hypothetical protein